MFLKEAGNREMCMNYDNALISCQGGFCKNVSKIYECTYKNTLVVFQLETSS